MTKWIPCGNGFIEADVVRWKEIVWEKRSRRQNARAVNVGDRVVTAEVLREDAEGWVHLITRLRHVERETGAHGYPSREGPGYPSQAAHYRARQARTPSLER